MRFSREAPQHFAQSFPTVKTSDQWLRFPGKVKNPNFRTHFCNYWMNQIFPGKSGFVSLLPLLSYNFMPSFGKILWPVIEKSSGLTNERTNGRTDMGQSIGPTSKVGGSKKTWDKDAKNLFTSNDVTNLHHFLLPKNEKSAFCEPVTDSTPRGGRY